MPRGPNALDRGWVLPVTAALLAACNPTTGELHQAAANRGDTALQVDCLTGPLTDTITMRLTGFFGVVNLAGTSYRLQLGGNSDATLQDLRNVNDPASFNIARIPDIDLRSGKPFEIAVGDTAVRLLLVQVTSAPQEVQITAYCPVDAPPDGL